MKFQRLISRLQQKLGLCSTPHVCDNGPMEGESLVLSEHSRNTAWLEVNGQVGRYVTDKRGKLVWEPRRE